MDINTIDAFVREHPAARILGQGGTEQERRVAAFQFVNTVAVDLREALHVNAGLVRRIPTDADPLDYESFVLALMAQDGTVQVHDVVSSHELTDAHVTFGPGADAPAEVFAEPDANFGYVVTTATPAVPEPTEVDLVQLLTDLHGSVLRVESILTQVMPQIDHAFGEIDDRLTVIADKLDRPAVRVSPAPLTEYVGEGVFFGRKIRFVLTPKQK